MKTVLTMVMTFVLVAGLSCQTAAQGRSASRDEAGGKEATSPVAAATDANDAAASSEGPTVRLSYGQGTSERNPMESFMYFIPLISPVGMDSQTSAENNQQAGVVSYERKVTSRTFSVNCEFEMKGRGSSRYTFDPAGMIALRIEESKKPKPDALTNVLDYIHFEGEGFGRIQIKGTISGSTQTVTEVELEFDGRSCKSPVIIGLYDLKPKSGRYKHENRSNQIVARVNSLIFRKSDNPKMGITVACISKKATANDFFGHLKAAIANLFIKPVKVTPVGNQALLDFGYALFEQKTAFTFPKATNLKAALILAAEPAGEGAEGN